MTRLRMLTTDDKIAEIRRLYFSATRQTIEGDLDRALDLLKSMPGEDERERATVYMEGLAEMRRDWLRPKRGQERKNAETGKNRGRK
jgi:hypothetical protein